MLAGCVECAWHTKEGAQHRSLRGLQHTLCAAPAAQWYSMVDNETDVDVSEAAAVVRGINPAVPLVAGLVVRACTRGTPSTRRSCRAARGC